jgi:opacity protein-like surface antigen
MMKFHRLGMALITFGILAQAGLVRAAGQTLSAAEPALGTNGLGGGFLSGAQTVSFELGAVGGVKILGSTQGHNLALASLAYGRMLGPVRGEDSWYRGNWELRLELFGGSQFSPSSYYIVGLTPHLRYDFATGTRWIPFVDVGAGATVTGIGNPDLSSTFEFNIQGGAGLHWLVSRNWAVTAEVRYFHVSDAEMTSPNNGVNGVMGLVGITRFF